MKRHFIFAACLVLLSLWLVSQVTAQQDQPTEQRIDFSRDIRPILSTPALNVTAQTTILVKVDFV